MRDEQCAVSNRDPQCSPLSLLPLGEGLGMKAYSILKLDFWLIER
jgi:hypothetical protein